MPPKAAPGKEETAALVEEEIVFQRTEYEEQCDRIFKELDRMFKRLHKTSKPEKIHNMIKDITAKLKEAKGLINDFAREARADGMSPNELTARKRVMAAELNGFIEMKKQFAQAEGSKGDLLNGAQPGGEIEMGTDGMSMTQLVNKGRKEMGEISSTLDRAHRNAEDTKQIGIALAGTLHDQTKQMERTVDALNEIEFTMQKASKIIRDITRGLLTDKCIAFLLLLVVLGVVAIIVLKIIKPNKDKVQQGAEAVLNQTSDFLNSTLTQATGRRMLVAKVIVPLLQLNATL